MIFVVKGREKFWKIKRGRERKSLGSPGLYIIFSFIEKSATKKEKKGSDWLLKNRRIVIGRIWMNFRIYNSTIGEFGVSRQIPFDGTE